MDRIKARTMMIIGIMTVFLLSGFMLIIVDDVEAAGRWRSLGKRTIHGKVDHDTIVVGAAKRPLRVLKFTVKGSALELHKIVVTFANGQKYSPDTRLVFKKGSWSRTIDLPGKDRVVKKVDFYYSNLPRGGRAHIKLLGR